MAIDPRIALGVQPVQIQSPLANFGQALQLKDLIGQQDLRALKMDEYRRKVGRENALRDLMMQHQGDRTKVIPALRAGGFYQEADEMEKTGAEIGYKQSQTQKNELESAMNGYKFAANMAAGVNSQQAYDAMKAQFAQNPMFAPVVQNMPAQWSPEVSEELKRGALAAAGKIEAMLPKVSDRDVGGTIQTVSTDPVSGRQTVAGVTPKTMTPGDVQQARDSAASRAIAAGNLDVARQRLELDRTAPKGVPMETSGGLVIVDPRSGSYRPATPAGVTGAQVEPSAQARPADFGQPTLGKTKAQLDSEIKTLEREAAQTKASDSRKDTIRTAENVVNSIDQALEKVGFFTTGFVGARMGGIEGTDAYSLRGTLETVKANFGFDRLQKMRDMSPTGGALGQVAVQELTALQASIANLDANQDEATLRRNLDKARKHYINWRNTLAKAEGMEPMKIEVNGATPPNPVIDDLLKKYGN